MTINITTVHEKQLLKNATVIILATCKHVKYQHATELAKYI